MRFYHKKYHRQWSATQPRKFTGFPTERRDLPPTPSMDTGHLVHQRNHIGSSHLKRTECAEIPLERIFGFADSATHAAARSFTHSVAGARSTYLRLTVVLPRNVRASSCVHPPASQSSDLLISKQLRMHASPRSLSKRRRPSWRISRLLHFSSSLPPT